MRWKIKSIEINNKSKGKGMIPKQPKLGDIKEKICFAYLPTSITPTDIIWLEKYIKVYEYSEKKSLLIKNTHDWKQNIINRYYNDNNYVTYNTWLLKTKKFYK